MHREYWLNLLFRNLSFLRNFKFSKSVQYCLRKNIFTLQCNYLLAWLKPSESWQQLETALLPSPMNLTWTTWQLRFHHCWPCTCTQCSWTLVTVLTYASNLFSIKFSFHLSASSLRSRHLGVQLGFGSFPLVSPSKIYISKFLFHQAVSHLKKITTTIIVILLTTTTNYK